MGMHLDVDSPDVPLLRSRLVIYVPLAHGVGNLIGLSWLPLRPLPDVWLLCLQMINDVSV